jgi:serine/threonine-protein kinase
VNLCGRQPLRSGALATIGATLLLVSACQREQQVEKAAPTPVPDAPRVVVYPFTNLGSPADGYIASGITEEITRRLSAVGGLVVVSRAGSSREPVDDSELPQIGQELGVGYLLDGEIRLVRDQDTVDGLVVAPRLVDLASGRELWNERFDRPLDDIFDIEARIARRVVDMLGVPIQDSELDLLAARPTTSLAAYDDYLQALPHCWSYEIEELRLAEQLLDQAIEHDPGFAIAHAMLSENHSLIYHFRYDRSPQRLARARAAVDRALELDPALPEGHRALGFFYYWGHRNYQYSLDEFARAAARRPNDALILSSMGIVHRRQGQWAEALQELERAAELDPRSDINVQDLASTCGRLRRYGDAERYCQQAIELAPDDFYPYIYCARIYRSRDGTTERARQMLESMPAKDPAQQGLYWFEQAMYERDLDSALRWASTLPDEISDPIDEETFTRSLAECHCQVVLGSPAVPPTACDIARVFFERARDASPADASNHAALGWVYALLDRRDDAIASGERAVELLPISADGMAGQTVLERLAKIYARAGDPDLALDTIEQSLAHPGWLSAGTLRLDPDWDPLRGHPRFQQLIQ